MDSTDKSIRFDEHGYCNYCTDTLNRKDQEYFPNNQGQEKLDQMMDTIKKEGKGRKYDCMIGISGGLDSSYVMYIAKKYGLRMLCVHIDDGLDMPIAKENIRKLCEKCEAELITVKPDMDQYKDMMRAIFLAQVPNLAIAQDNILHGALRDTAKKYDINYSLSGANFSMECILQRGADYINACDKKHLLAIHKRFGSKPINKLRFISLFDYYITNRYFRKTTILKPLNYIDYQLKPTLDILANFSGFVYYGGKHYESVLTRFLQCYWLPTYFDFDKRKSHFSSLIVSDQMTREEALERLSRPAYLSEDLLKEDKRVLANFIGMNEAEFEALLAAPKHRHSDYPMSSLHKLAPLARKMRKFLG